MYFEFVFDGCTLKMNKISILEVSYNYVGVATYTFDGSKVLRNKGVYRKELVYFSLRVLNEDYSLLNTLKIPLSKSLKFCKMLKYFRLKTAYNFKPFKQIYTL